MDSGLASERMKERGRAVAAPGQRASRVGWLVPWAPWWGFCGAGSGASSPLEALLSPLPTAASLSPDPGPNPRQFPGPSADGGPGAVGGPVLMPGVGSLLLPGRASVSVKTWLVTPEGLFLTFPGDREGSCTWGSQ